MAGLFNIITLAPNESYTIAITPFNCYGLWIIKETRDVGSIVLYLAEPKKGEIVCQINNDIISVSSECKNGIYSIYLINTDFVERTFEYKKIG